MNFPENKKKKIPIIWKYYFFIGFALLNIHFIRYLNLFINKSVPYLNYIVDYSLYSNKAFILRLITFFLNILALKKREYFPILSTIYIWIATFILLSHAHDKYTFLSGLIIIIFSIFSLFYYKQTK